MKGSPKKIDSISRGGKKHVTIPKGRKTDNFTKKLGRPGQKIRGNMGKS